ncbi:hypothetical protein BDZ89DRAFT_1043322 [Hymenopellis radicata]|nr:hypothetical protein BDZ89DRAFT_1043322 [Hymenopellis radicata]
MAAVATRAQRRAAASEGGTEKEKSSPAATVIPSQEDWEEELREFQGQTNEDEEEKEDGEDIHDVYRKAEAPIPTLHVSFSKELIQRFIDGYQVDPQFAKIYTDSPLSSERWNPNQ